MMKLAGHISRWTHSHAVSQETCSQSRFVLARIFRFPLAAVPRGIALFFGSFSILNVLGELAHDGFDANIWWIHIVLPHGLSHGLFLLSGLLLVATAVTRSPSRYLRVATSLVCGVLSAIAIKNSVTYYELKSAGRIQAPVWFPLSMFIAAALLTVAVWCWAQSKANRDEKKHRGMLLSTVLIAACVSVIFPLAQMVCFGYTDYRTPSDAAIVFGAKAYASGRPSTALADRVATSCELYHQGLVRKLIFSGGPGHGEFHETEVMRRYAVSLGVPNEAIICDEHGLNTQATAINTAPLLDQHGISRALAVSHFYHLPRIKLCFRRVGVKVRTVPCRESATMLALPYYITREVAAFWWYYIRPLTPGCSSHS